MSTFLRFWHGEKYPEIFGSKVLSGSLILLERCSTGPSISGLVENVFSENSPWKYFCKRRIPTNPYRDQQLCWNVSLHSPFVVENWSGAVHRIKVNILAVANLRSSIPFPQMDTAIWIGQRTFSIWQAILPLALENVAIGQSKRPFSLLTIILPLSHVNVHTV